MLSRRIFSDVLYMYVNAVLLSLAAASVPLAHAGPVTWTVSAPTLRASTGGFSGNTVDPGGTISGTFQFDADTSTYSNINIVSTQGDITFTQYDFAGATYSTVFSSGQTFLNVTDTNNAYEVQFSFFNQALTNAGGTISDVTLQEDRCNGPCSNHNGNNQMRQGSGTFTADAAAPEPASMGLMIFACIPLGWMACRRKRLAQR